MKKSGAFQKILGVLLLAIAFVCVKASAAPVSGCAGCESLKSVAEKIRTVSRVDEKKIADLLNDASRAISSMPRSKSKQLKTAQVREMVSLLSQVVKVDKVHLVLEDAIELIQANKAQFNKEVARLPAEDAKTLKAYVAVVEAEQAEGNDPAPSARKK